MNSRDNSDSRSPPIPSSPNRTTAVANEWKSETPSWCRPSAIFSTWELGSLAPMQMMIHGGWPCARAIEALWPSGVSKHSLSSPLLSSCARSDERHEMTAVVKVSVCVCVRTRGREREQCIRMLVRMHVSVCEGSSCVCAYGPCCSSANQGTAPTATRRPGAPLPCELINEAYCERPQWLLNEGGEILCRCPRELDE